MGEQSDQKKGSTVPVMASLDSYGQGSVSIVVLHVQLSPLLQEAGKA